jgi:hypothetical protein
MTHACDLHRAAPLWLSGDGYGACAAGLRFTFNLRKISERGVDSFKRLSYLVLVESYRDHIIKGINLPVDAAVHIGDQSIGPPR